MDNRFFKKMSMLQVEELESIRLILHGKQPFSIYFNAALEALKNGLDNRWFHLNSDSGLAMVIDFDGLRICSIVGDILYDAVASMVANPRRTEFHVESKYADMIIRLAGKRVIRQAQLKYYLLHRSELYELPVLNLRLMTPKDLLLVEEFYSQNYDGTIFSAWMLEQPFIGLFVNEQLVSAGGTVVLDRADSAANLGNFLTAPNARGRGHVQSVAKALINELLRMGINTYTLGTTEENTAAWRAWESVGFKLLERRIEIELSSFKSV